MSSFICADFVVVPSELRRVLVPDPVVVRFRPEAVESLSFLGKTGKQMAAAGFRFKLTSALAAELVLQNQAVAVPRVEIDANGVSSEYRGTHTYFTDNS
jgi:hypothetical protein